MSALRHRISRFFAPSEDSGTDSMSSTRAIRGSDNSITSRESSESRHTSTAATTREDLSLKVEPAVDASPRTLKKAASTTFQAVSNSIRSRTQSFYTISTRSPPRSGRKTPDNQDETWSPSRKQNGSIQRPVLADPFSNFKKERPQSPNTQSTVASPKAANSSSPIWASIKKRTGNSPHFNKAGQTENPGSPIPFVEPIAPSLNVEIPDHILSVSQHIQRRNSRRVQPGSPETPPKAISHSPTCEQMQSRPELRIPLDGRSSVKGVSNHLSLLPLFQITSVDKLPANEREGTKNNGGQHIRFLPLNTPLRIPLPPSPSEKTASPSSSLDSTPAKTINSSEEHVTLAQPRSPMIRRGRSLQRRMNYLGNKRDVQESHPLFSAEDDDLDNLHNDKSPVIDQESMPTTPERPNMGSRSALNRARAERKDRYLALLDQDLETASDTETDPDLNLIPSPAKTFRHPSHKSTTTGPDNSSQDPFRPTDKYRFAVEAIDRPSGTVYDQSDTSDTEGFNQVSTLFSGDLPYMVEAIERMPQFSSSVPQNSSPVLEDIERRKAKSPGLLEGPSSGNSNLAQIPQKTPEDTGVISLAQIVQDLRESKRSSESTVAAESDPLLGEGQDRMQNKVDRVKTPIPEENDTTTNQAKPLGVSSPPSSKYSSSTDVSCALTTHDPLCYAPAPWPTVHCRTSPSPDRASSKHTAQSPSNDNDIGDENGTKMESQIEEYKRSPWANLFGSHLNITEPKDMRPKALLLKDLLPKDRKSPSPGKEKSPSAGKASSTYTAQNPSNDDGKGGKKDAKLGFQIDEDKRSPWSNFFDKHIHMIDITEPKDAPPKALLLKNLLLKDPRPKDLPPKDLPLRPKDLQPKDLPPNDQPPNHQPPKDTGLSEITLPASTFLRLSSSELQIRPREDHDFEIRHTASERGYHGSVTSDLDEDALLRKFEHSPKSMERPFIAARLPAFGETLPQLAYSPPRGRKVPNKAKRPVRYNGNANKSYTYSQIVKGDKKVDEVKRSLELIGSLEDDGPNEKGVSWAKEDELIGYADPQTPISKRISADSPDRTFAEGHDVKQVLDTSNKENAALGWKPSVEPDFRVCHYIVMNASIDTPDVNFPEMLEKQSQLSRLDESKPGEMTPSVRKVLKNLFKLDEADTAMEGAAYDIHVVSPWNESEKRRVAKHLMSVVYDLEELSAVAELEEEEDGDESEEKEKKD